MAVVTASSSGLGVSLDDGGAALQKYFSCGKSCYVRNQAEAAGLLTWADPRQDHHFSVLFLVQQMVVGSRPMILPCLCSAIEFNPILFGLPKCNLLLIIIDLIPIDASFAAVRCQSPSNRR